MTETITTLPYKSTLSEAALEKARRELNEDPATRQQKVNELRDLFKTRPDIKFRPDDSFLLKFLRAKKFDTKRAFKMLISYYEVKRSHKDIFDNFSPSAVQYIYDSENEMICPGRDKDGRAVFIIRVGNRNFDVDGVSENIRSGVTMTEALLLDEDIQVNGVVFVCDWKGLSAKHMKHLGPMVVKKVADIYLSAMPLRLKAIHMVNQQDLFKILFGFLKPFLSQKIKNRIYFHGDEYGTLHEHIPSAMLPSDLGGQLPGYSNNEWISRTLAAEEEFVYNSQFGFLKPDDILGKQETQTDPATGLTGTFKKLIL